MQVDNKHIIFIDTSIFEAQNFLKGRNIILLCELSRKGEIELKITDIVYEELKQRLKANVLKAKTAYKKAHSLIDGEGKILKNINDYDNFYPLPKIDVDTELNKLITQLDLFLADNSIEIIDSKISNLKEVFTNYFQENPPFKEGKKKSEFPDAFTYSTIKEWTSQNDKKVFFISNDSDFKELTIESIDCTHNLSSLLDLISREIDEKHTIFIEQLYRNSFLNITEALETEFSYELSVAAFNKIESDPFIEDSEVQELDNIEAKIDIAVLNEITINKGFSYEIESNITFSVYIDITDLSMAHYDKEDGIWWGEERKTITKEFSANVISVAVFEYTLDNETGNYLRMENFEIREVQEI